MVCEGSLVESTVHCYTESSTQGGISAALIGGQNTNVRLTSSNVVYTEEDSIFQFDVTVQNLRPERMGTADGVTPHSEGIRVFFSAAPTPTSGSGSAEVENPDGVATFTATNQAFYQYNEILDTNEVTAARTWRLHIEPTVETFAFTVYVSTELALPAPSLAAVRVASGLSQPVYLTAPAGDSRLFVVEQTGRIRIIQDGEVLEQPFLNLSGRISSGGERGLLSMAFHPNYATNGFFYVNFTGSDGATEIERFSVSDSNPNQANASSAYRILRVAQPESNHNGGLITFGPDGMLYIGMGDGGGGGDPYGNGQNLETLHGAMLRIDVDGGAPYAIPAGNPFVGTAGARPEIWAYGLRNPWRFSFDSTAGLLYIGDVGQSLREEINIVSASQAGVNYGWNTMEGTTCYSPRTGCDQMGLTLPVYEYPTSDGCAVTGGYVYRGSAMPELRGTYIYADYCSGQVSSFRYTDGTISEHTDWNLGSVGLIASFGEDAAGELYIIDRGGSVYRLERASPAM